MWPDEAGVQRLRCQHASSNVVYTAVQGLSPHDDTQRKLKRTSHDPRYDWASFGRCSQRSRRLHFDPMLIILVSWLVVIFLGFSVLARPMPPYLRFDGFALAVGWPIFLIWSWISLWRADPDFQRGRCSTLCTSSK